MKKNYAEPKLEIKKFDAEYVVTTSGFLNSKTYNQAITELETGGVNVSPENIFSFKL